MHPSPLLRRRIRTLARPGASAAAAAELAELRQELERMAAAHRAKGAFLASLSHQLRTPLNSIQLYSELLGEDLRARGAGDLTVDLGCIQEAGRLLLSLIDDILDLSRMEAGRMIVEPAEIDVAALVAGLEPLFREQAAQHGNRLELRVEPESGPLRSDPRRLSQILYHLLDNALKFTRDGQVTLAAAPAAGGLRFTVGDTGPGMAAEQVDLIRAEFARNEASESARFGNAGLGLTLCRRLAELLGGALGVDSQPGHGASFTLTLPWERP